MNDKLIKWLQSGDTGLSSKTIVAVMEGNPALGAALMGRYGYCHPLDPSDLGRCFRLLEAIPEYRPRMKEMRVVSQVWHDLVDAWDELEALWIEESPKLYDRMKAIIDSAEKTEREPDDDNDVDGIPF